MTQEPGPSSVADLRPLARMQDQKAWYWYDWANSAFSTTIAGVLFGPYLIAVAEADAVDNRISVLGLAVAPGALPAARARARAQRAAWVAASDDAPRSALDPESVRCATACARASP